NVVLVASLERICYSIAIASIQHSGSKGMRMATKTITNLIEARDRLELIEEWVAAAHIQCAMNRLLEKEEQDDELDQLQHSCFHHQ
ncbi:MAG: hypothetical protein V2J51_12835, partial [Erythrobacter sp.]|nr:hypothetical protein [Erythrobacter sp.]